MCNTPFNMNSSEWLKISQEDIATINNALAIISGYAQLLVRQPYVRPEDKKKLEEIVKQVERIEKLLPEAGRR